MKKKLLVVLGSSACALMLAAGILTAVFMPTIKQYLPVVEAALPMLTYSNMKAVYINALMDETQKAQKLKEIDNKLSKDLENYVSISIREFTEEEINEIESGEKTKTEIIAKIITESAGQNDAQSENEQNEQVNDKTQTESNADKKTDSATSDKPAPDSQGKAEPVKKQETADEIVARHITVLYTYHGEFESRVSDLATSARSWMHMYKKANPGISWRDAKVATMQHFMATANQIESDCYAKVDAQIAKMENELKAIGADLSVVSTVRSAAYNEMDVRKSKIVSEGQSKLAN